MITKPIRYEKRVPIVVNNTEYQLIDYLSLKRQEKGITKKDISLIIKNNNYWYSQIEMGENDNNRRRFINRNDLVDIISVIFFDAKTVLDLEYSTSFSERYIDETLKITSYDKSPRPMPVYEMIAQFNKSTAPEVTNLRLDNCLSDLNNTINKLFHNADPIQQIAIINLLNAFIYNLSTNPIIMLHFCSIPFSIICKAKAKNEEAEKIIAEDFYMDMENILSKYCQLLCEEDAAIVFNQIEEILKKSISASSKHSVTKIL